MEMSCCGVLLLGAVGAMLPATHGDTKPCRHPICMYQQCLQQCKKQVHEELGVPLQQIELSMGMSGDFENAVWWVISGGWLTLVSNAHTPQVEMGSTNIRVGSTIFGARNYA